MKTVTIKGVGVVTIPERNTEEEIINIVELLKHDPKTLHEMLCIEPIKLFWCEHWTCLETIDPFNSEEELHDHICKCHKIPCSDVSPTHSICGDTSSPCEEDAAQNE